MEKMKKKGKHNNEKYNQMPNAPPVGNAVVETPRAPKVSEPWSLVSGRPPTADYEGGHCHWDPIFGTSPGPAKGHAQTHGLRSTMQRKETPSG